MLPPYRVRLFVIAALLPAALAAGCSKRSPQAIAGGHKAATGPVTVVYIPKNTGNPYFDSIVQGFKKGCGELHDTFTTVAPATADAASQIPFIQDQVQRGVSAIAISPNSPDAIKPALKQAMAQGIVVVAVNGDMPGSEDGREACVLPMDFGITGTSQLDLVSGLIGGKGDFAILSATTDAPDQNTWIASMKAALKTPKYAGLHLVQIAYGNDDPQKSLTEAQGLLTQFPNLKCIDAPTSVGIAAAAQAVEVANAAGRVQVTGLGTPNQMRRFVKDGTVKKFALWSPFDEGYLAAYLIHGMVKGAIKPGAGVSFPAGTLGNRQFGAKNVVVTGPPLVFDASNIDKYHF
ncbi:MAG: substrate-binding domain-containing protein [Armatimonadetes bacterium]|nr:substrate-binding domain-containing protein [Armatimonadota bacterium]MDE2205262.1 substrate-binding domain-containing protein [Armatimonadota bacterium]